MRHYVAGDRVHIRWNGERFNATVVSVEPRHVVVEVGSWVDPESPVVEVPPIAEGVIATHIAVLPEGDGSDNAYIIGHVLEVPRVRVIDTNFAMRAEDIVPRADAVRVATRRKTEAAAVGELVDRLRVLGIDAWRDGATLMVRDPFAIDQLRGYVEQAIQDEVPAHLDPERESRAIDRAMEMAKSPRAG